MTIEVQRLSTAPARINWLIGLWWASVIFTCALLNGAVFSRRDDMPGVVIVWIGIALLIGAWRLIFDHTGHHILRALTERSTFYLYLSFTITLTWFPLLTDPSEPLAERVSLGVVSVVLSLLIAASIRRYVVDRRFWIICCCITGLVAALLGVLVSHTLIPSRDERSATMIGMAVLTIIWAIVPGVVLARHVRDLPPAVVDDLKLYAQKTEWGWDAKVGRLLFAVSLLLLIGIFAYAGLRPCGWLDVVVGRSGCQGTIYTGRSTSDLAYAGNTSLFVLDYDDGADHLRYIDLQSQGTTSIKDLPRSRVTDLQVSPNGGFVAVAYESRDTAGKVEVWSLPSLDPVKSYESLGNHVAFSPDEQMIGFGNTIWNVQNGGVVHQFVDDARIEAFSPDGQYVALRNDDIEVWRVGDWHLVAQLSGRNSSSQRLLFTSDSTGIVVVPERNPGYAIIYDIQSGNKRHQQYLNTDVLSQALSPDGQYLAVGGGDWDHGVLWVLRTSDLAIVRTYRGFRSAVASIAWSKDGMTIAGAEQYRDRVLFWSAP